MFIVIYMCSHINIYFERVGERGIHWGWHDPPLPCPLLPWREEREKPPCRAPPRPVTKSVIRAPIRSCRRRRKESLISTLRRSLGLGSRPRDQRLLTSSPTITYEDFVTGRGAAACLIQRQWGRWGGEKPSGFLMGKNIQFSHKGTIGQREGVFAPAWPG